MKKIKSEKGSISVFVIIAFIFCMTVLISIYWSNTNYQIMAAQGEQRIKDIYGNEVERKDEIHQMISSMKEEEV